MNYSIFLELMIIFTNASIIRTSTSTYPVVACSTVLSIPYNAISIAITTASSKKYDVFTKKFN